MTTMLRLVRGLGALLLLGVLLVGLPWLLLRIGTSLLPHHLPSWTELQVLMISSGGTQAFLFLLTVAGWIAWVVFAVSAVVEVVAVASRQRIHPRLPGLGSTTQKLVAVLIVAVVMAVLPHGSPAVAAPSKPAAPQPPAVSRTVSHAPDRPTRPVHQPAQTTSKAAHRTVVDHRVKAGETLWGIAERYTGYGGNWRQIAATNHLHHGELIPAGRHLRVVVETATTNDNVVTVHDGDTLSAIAEDHLGRGSAWPKIYDANRDQIRNPDLIYPGEQLQMPDPVSRSGSVQPPARQSGSGHTRPGHTGEARTGKAQAHSPQPSASPRSAPAQPSTTPRSSADQPSATPHNAPAEPSTAAQPTGAAQPGAGSPSAAANPEVHDDGVFTGFDGPIELAVEFALGAGLLAAGLRLALRRRRARQVWSQTPGQSLPEPDPDTQLVEAAITQDPMPAVHEHFGDALQAISAHTRLTGGKLPEVVAARVAEHRIDLLLAKPHLDPPNGIRAINGGRNWTIDEDHLAEVMATDGIEGASQPFPTLVTIGRDADLALMLLDLERAGLLSVETDNPVHKREVLTALTVEMAVSPWNADLRLILVGDVCPGLETALDVPTVTRLATAGETAEMLEATAVAQRCHLELSPELASIGVEDRGVVQIRTDPDLAESWSPTIVIFDHEPGQVAQERLRRAALAHPRVAIAVVATTEETGPDNTDDHPIRLVLDAAGETATIQPFGWHLHPQRVSEAIYPQIIDSLSTSGRDDTVPDSSWWDQDTDIDANDGAPVGDNPTAEPTDAVLSADETDSEDIPEDNDRAEDTRTDPAGLVPVETTAAGDTGDTNNGADVDAQRADVPPQRPLLSSGSLLDRLAPDLSKPDGTAVSGDQAGRDPADRDQGFRDVDYQDADNDEDLSNQQSAGGGPDAGSRNLVLLPTRTAYPRPDVPFLHIFGSVELSGEQGQLRRSGRTPMLLLILLLDKPGITNKTIANTLCLSGTYVRSIVSTLRTWLGNDSEGQPFLPLAYVGGRYRVDDRITSDWQQLQLLIHSGDISDVTDARLADAFRWIRGVPFEDLRDVTRDEAGWFAIMQSRVRDTAIKVARETTRRALHTGDFAAARHANQLALDIEPHREDILTDAFSIETASGNHDNAQRLARVIDNQATEFGLDLRDETRNVLAGAGRRR